MWWVELNGRKEQLVLFGEVGCAGGGEFGGEVGRRGRCLNDGGEA